jgi:DNA-binding MarR family transcriptional regulator
VRGSAFLRLFFAGDRSRAKIVAKSNYIFYPDSVTALATQISALREFNRFYTARLGLLRKRHLDGAFSLTEARALYEIGAHPRITASSLCATLALDAGYLSRLLAALTRRKFIHQTSSKTDGREKLLTLTAAGEKSVARLNEQSDVHIEGILAGIDSRGRDSLLTALSEIRRILDPSRDEPVKIVRLKQACDEALQILEEYYEAAHVVQRDEPGSLQGLMDEAGSGMWLASQGDEVVGCVVLRRLPSVPFADSM